MMSEKGIFPGKMPSRVLIFSKRFYPAFPVQ